MENTEVKIEKRGRKKTQTEEQRQKMIKENRERTAQRSAERTIKMKQEYSSFVPKFQEKLKHSHVKATRYGITIRLDALDFEKLL